MPKSSLEMQYRGVNYSVVRGGPPNVWRWSVLIPGQAAHLFRDDAAHPFRLIVARHSD
jgi:hypothetical protein